MEEDSVTAETKAETKIFPRELNLPIYVQHKIDVGSDPEEDTKGEEGEEGREKKGLRNGQKRKELGLYRQGRGTAPPNKKMPQQHPINIIIEYQ